MMISYAQNFEDVVLWRVLKDIGAGRYVDVGAFHPEVDSVTKWFYDQGWSGVNIEPIPETFALLEAARPRDRNVRAAAGAVAGMAEMVTMPSSPGLSSLSIAATEEGIDMPQTIVQVDVWPLHQILQPYAGQTIHFLKIDAEGSERDVLLGMDFEKFRPWIILVEATAPMSPRRTSSLWEEILVENNYRHAYFDGLNDFYVASEKFEIAERLAMPPNVFDEFELSALVRERKAAADLRAAFAELQNSSSEILKLRDDELLVVRAELSTVRNALETKSKAMSELQQELTNALSKMAEVQARCDAADSEVQSYQTSLARLSGELGELAQAIRQGRAREEGALRQASDSELKLQQVLNSRSFRWLAPARSVRRILFPPKT
jgi:FkbM family methyltransferase